MNLQVSAEKLPNGNVKVSWIGSIETKIHDLLIRGWFGKKRNSSTTLYPIYVWASWNPHNGEVEMTGSRELDLSLFDKSWQQANFDGYICQFNSADAPADQYHCVDSNTAKITKK